MARCAGASLENLLRIAVPGAGADNLGIFQYHACVDAGRLHRLSTLITPVDNSSALKYNNLPVDVISIRYRS